VLYREGIKNYKVYQDGVVVGSPTTSNFNVTGLTTATTYNFQISAVGNDNVEGPKSAVVTVTTL